MSSPKRVMNIASSIDGLLAMRKHGLGSRIFRAIVLSALGVTAIAAAQTVPATATAYNFGPAAVGASAITAQVRFTFSAAVTLASVGVTTQGNTALDFNPGNPASDSCQPAAYAAGSSCTVAVNFTPLAAGTRTGAIVLFSADSTPLLTQRLTGTGTSPLLVFNPGSTTSMEAGLGNAAAVAVDAAGNRFFSDIATGSILESSANGTQTTVATGFTTPAALAIDAAGNLLVADSARGELLLLTRNATGSFSAPIVLASNLNGIAALAIDAQGRLLAGVANTILAFAPAASGYSASQPVASLQAGTTADAITLDAAGNIYIASKDAGTLLELTINGSQNILLNDLRVPASLAIDAAGNLYIAESNGHNVIEFNPSTGARQSLAHDVAVSALALDNTGDLTLAIAFSTSFTEILRSHPAINLGPAAQHPRMAASVQNAGNAPLTLSSIAVTTTGTQTIFSRTASQNTRDCANGDLLQAGQSCGLTVQAAPAHTTASIATGSAQVQSNTLNQSAPVSVMALISPLSNSGILAFVPALASSLNVGSTPGTITVAVENANGQTVTTSAATVTLTLTLPDTTSSTYTAAAVNGLASFNLADLSLIEAGSTIFTATDGSDTAATSTITVLPLTTAARLIVSGYPSSVLSGTAHAVTVTVRDRYNNIATGFTGTVTLSSSDAAAVFAPAAYTFTAADAGTHSFQVTLNTVATQHIIATTSSVSGSEQNIAVIATGGVTSIAVDALNTTSPITTIAHGAAVTLRSTVLSTNNTAVTAGTVAFIDAALPTSLQLIGTAQLLANGTASINFVPAAGAHSLRAVFAGTTASPASVSSIAALTVTGLGAVNTTLTITGTPLNYTLAATLDGFALGAAPTGSINFVDQSNSNAVVGQVALNSLTETTIPQPAATAGSMPQSVVTGDFNGDGITDIAILNGGDATITILLGKGDGTFTAAPNSPLAAGTDPGSITAGDVNNDGKLDLAVTDNANSDVLIYKGNGDGTFAAPTSVAVGYSPYGVTLADFNGDGVLDMAVTLDSTNSVAILLGNGDGTFHSSGSPIAVGLQPSQIVAADFNNDGHADLAVANYGENTVSILLGSGFGTFTAAVASPVTVGNSPSSLAAVDLNSDGNIDLAVANQSDSTVSVLLGDGHGAFLLGKAYATGTQPASIIASDMNGDGAIDLLTANFDSSSISVLLNNGSAAFTDAGSIATGSGPVALAVADFNGDARPDIAVANYGNHNAGIYLGTQSETAVLTNVDITTPGMHQVAAVYNGDANYAAYTSKAVAVISSAVPTTLTISLAAGSSSDYGTAITLSAVVAPGTSYGLTPAGTVTYSDNGAAIGVANYPGATLTIVPAAGSHSFAASYTGSAGFAASTSNAIASTVTRATTTTSVAAVHGVYGQSASIAVTITPEFSSGTALPTGSITYQIGSAAAQTATVSNGQATLTPPGNLAIGTGAVSIAYSGDANYRGSATSSTYTITPGVLTVTASSATRVYGAANPTLTGTVTGAATGDVFTATYSTSAVATSNAGSYIITPAITGANIASYTVVIKTATLTVTQATLTASANSATRIFGTQNPSFTGTFSGAVNGDVFTGSYTTTATTLSNAGAYAIVPSLQGTALGNYTVNATNGTLTIQQTGATIQLATIANAVPFNSPATFTATVATTTSGTPTGHVIFFDGTAQIGTAALAGGVATFTDSVLSSGTHIISATYAGDVNFTTVTSGTVQQSIGNAQTDYTITAAPPAISIHQGQYGTSSITVQPAAGFIGSITFSCSNLPQSSNCTFVYPTLSFDGSGTAQTTGITVATTGLNGYLDSALPVQTLAQGGRRAMLAGILLVPGIFVLGLLFTTRRATSTKSLHILGALIIGMVMMSVTGCSVAPGAATPLGTTTLTVTATPSIGSNAPAHTLAIAVTVTQ